MEHQVANSENYLEYIINNFNDKNKQYYSDKIFILFHKYLENSKILKSIERTEYVVGVDTPTLNNNILYLFKLYFLAFDQVEFVNFNLFIQFYDYENCFISLDSMQSLFAKYSQRYPHLQQLIDTYYQSVEASRNFSTHMIIPNIKEYIAGILACPESHLKDHYSFKYFLVSKIIQSVINHQNKRMKRKYYHFLQIILDRDQAKLSANSFNASDQDNDYYMVHQKEFITTTLLNELRKKQLLQFDVDFVTLDQTSAAVLAKFIKLFLTLNKTDNLILSLSELAAQGLGVRTIEYILEYFLQDIKNDNNNSCHILKARIGPITQTIIDNYEKSFALNYEMRMVRRSIKYLMLNLYSMLNFDIQDEIVLKWFGKYTILAIVAEQLHSAKLTSISTLKQFQVFYYSLNPDNSSLIVKYLLNSLQDFIANQYSAELKLKSVDVIKSVYTIFKHRSYFKDVYDALIKQIRENKLQSSLLSYLNSNEVEEYSHLIAYIIYSLEYDEPNFSNFLLKTLNQDSLKSFKLMTYIFKAICDSGNHIKIKHEFNQILISKISSFSTCNTKDSKCESKAQKYAYVMLVILIEFNNHHGLKESNESIKNLIIDNFDHLTNYNSNLYIELLKRIFKYMDSETEIDSDSETKTYTEKRDAHKVITSLLLKINSNTNFKRVVKPNPETIQATSELVVKMALLNYAEAEETLRKLDQFYESHGYYYKYIQILLLHEFEANKNNVNYVYLLSHFSTTIEAKTHYIEQFVKYPVSLLYTVNLTYTQIYNIDERQRLKLIIYSLTEQLCIQEEVALNLIVNSFKSFMQPGCGIFSQDDKRPDKSIEEVCSEIDSGVIQVNYRPNTDTHKLWLKKLQYVVILSNNLNPSVDRNNLQLVIKLALSFLKLNNYSNVKAYLEILLCKLLLLQPEYTFALMEEALLKPADMLSVLNYSILIALNAFVRIKTTQNEPISRSMLDKIEEILPLYMVSNNGYSRAVGMLMAFTVYRYDLVQSESLKKLVAFYNNHEVMKGFTEKTSAVFEKYVELVKQTRVAELFSMEVDEYGEYYHDSILVTLNAEIASTLTMLSNIVKMQNLCSFSIHQVWRVVLPEYYTSGTELIDLGLKEKESDAQPDFVYQKKYVPHESNSKFRIQVVTSLLQDDHNIAGICRTAECLNIEAVVLPNRNMLDSKTFKQMAASSDRHLPLYDVHPANIAEYLNLLRSYGYLIIALEQTNNAVDLYELEDYVFERFNTKFDRAKIVVVLGNESRGLGLDVLKYVDMCCVIPMYGQVRSFNVHVSCSMMLYEMTKMMVLKKNV